MFENNNRAGRFTSSQIVNLMKNGRAAGSVGAPFFTYVDKKRRERKLKRSFSLNKGNRSTAWGHLMEAWVMFDKLGFTYEHHGKKTSIHPKYNFWAGTTDLLQAGVKVGDIKCYEPDNFTQLADVLLQKDVSAFKKAYESEYWQLVSNACIHGVTKAESILFMPIKSELDRIRTWLNDLDVKESEDLHRYRYILDASDEDLPYLPEECTAYESLITFEFEIPQEDIDALTARVLMAEDELVNPKTK